MFGLVGAPDINRNGMEWFNVPEPLSLDDLKGRMVILDFWTFCCINCMHALPTLRKVEEAFPDEVVVIGIHSPKFAAERNPYNLAHAIQRYGIRHPVVHDPTMVLWEEYCVRAWPTLMFIGPDGGLLGELSGEPDTDHLLRGIRQMLKGWKAEGALTPTPLPRARGKRTSGRLRYPGKIKPVSMPDGTRLWAVADSGHHQIALLDDAGQDVRRFGSGQAGFFDAGPETSAFNAPQGLVAGNGALFVADTGNHVIRRIDLGTGETVTLAGTGQRGLALGAAALGYEVSLASPWDIEFLEGVLFFANAGTHQLGQLDLATNHISQLAGSGNEDIVDGPAADAALAQPSGLALDTANKVLFFADAETSAVRSLDLKPGGRVETLVGRGLFDYGHENGTFSEARLQHPLGLTAIDGKVIVADSYNGCLRTLDLRTRTIDDLREGRFACDEGCCLHPGEPAGVWADGEDRLLISDTNNHRILEVRPKAATLRVWAS